MELPRQKEEGEEEKRRKPTSYQLFLKTDDPNAKAKACALIPLDIQEDAVLKRKLEEFKRQIDANSLEVSELLSLQGCSVLPMAIRQDIIVAIRRN
uniref:uncharacterized protein LOC105349648 isoform X2 n=1 Tax=Fragaria vesca subsp. vesca TaxID=101020 RepID=UPI0005CA5914|nr:PREDICTED: uncharacterized protein LOC105349648 isoform X2 [Fragaria vesca subsp. vesca]